MDRRYAWEGEVADRNDVGVDTDMDVVDEGARRGCKYKQ